MPETFDLTSTPESLRIETPDQLYAFFDTLLPPDQKPTVDLLVKRLMEEWEDGGCVIRFKSGHILSYKMSPQDTSDVKGMFSPMLPLLFQLMKLKGLKGEIAWQRKPS